MRSKFVPGVRATIIDGIRKGLTIRDACALARVDESQYYRWMERGKDAAEDTTWHQFYLDCRMALAEWVAPNVARIDQAGRDGDWRATAWLLERRVPTEWGNGDRRAPAQAVGVIAVTLPGQPVEPSSTVIALPRESDSPAQPA